MESHTIYQSIEIRLNWLLAASEAVFEGRAFDWLSDRPVISVTLESD